MKRLVLGVGLLLVTSCGSDGGPVGPPADLAQAMRLWNAHGIRDYQVNEQRGCFCPPPHEWTTVVQAGQVVGQGWTVEEQFEKIRLATGVAHRLDVEYDAQYGYPTDVYIDWNAQMADDEMNYQMSDLQRIQP